MNVQELNTIMEQGGKLTNNPFGWFVITHDGKHIFIDNNVATEYMKNDWAVIAHITDNNTTTYRSKVDYSIQ